MTEASAVHDGGPTPSHKDVILAMFQARGDAYERTGNLSPLHDVFTSDIVYHFGGASRYAGEYVGVDAMIDLWEQQRQYMLGREYSVELLDILVGDKYSVAVSRQRGRTEDGNLVEWVGSTVYRIVDGKIAEAIVCLDNQQAYDDFWRG